MEKLSNSNKRTEFKNYIIDNYLFKYEAGRPPYIEKKISLIWNWITNTDNLGDVIAYLESIHTSKDAAMVQANSRIAQEIGKNFLDISIELRVKFGEEAHRTTTLEMFKKGNLYSSFDICYLFKNYNVLRSVIFSEDIPQVVFAKAGVDESKYVNGWINEKKFRYYLFSKVSKGLRSFDVNHAFNKVLMPNLANDIFLFLKDDDRNYELVGIFQSMELFEEPDGAKWVTLDLKE